MAVKPFSGGAALQAKLRELAMKVSNPGTLKVGFLEGSAYPDGTPIPVVAAAQEFGANITIPAHDQTIYRRINASSTGFLNHGRFVKRSKANFQSTHVVPAYTVRIPPRPFFRRMIAMGEKHWGEDVGKALIAKRFDAKQALAVMGEQLVGELKQSITDQAYTPLANSTAKKKGFDTTLVDTGAMRDSVDYEIEQ
jgi:hypothetical protein